MQCFGQELYVKTFGAQTSQPILFLHGGPGYNSANFEISTAEKLAAEDYFVIVYDRRGEGRSTDPNAKFTFEETFDDINNILSRFNLKKVSLMGHSFGGIVAVLYAEKFPEKTSNVFLIGAPVALQETFLNVIEKCKKIYQEKDDKTNLNYIGMLEKMDTSTMPYASYCFMHAMQNGFYTPKALSDEAKTVYKEFMLDPQAKLASQMTQQAPMGFWTNEKYTTLDLSENIRKLVKNKISVFGLYGKEDGLFSEKQVLDLQNIIGSKNLLYLDQCSHNVFIDQQQTFIDTVKKWN